MNKEILEKVKEHFKDAKTVRCLFDNDVCEIYFNTIGFNKESIYCNEKRFRTVILWTLEKGFAEIVERKECNLKEKSLNKISAVVEAINKIKEIDRNHLHTGLEIGKEYEFSNNKDFLGSIKIRKLAYINKGYNYPYVVLNESGLPNIWKYIREVTKEITIKEAEELINKDSETKVKIKQ